MKVIVQGNFHNVIIGLGLVVTVIGAWSLMNEFVHIGDFHVGVKQLEDAGYDTRPELAEELQLTAIGQLLSGVAITCIGLQFKQNKKEK